MFEGDPVVDDMHGWYPVDDLPEPMVDSHITDIIPIALGRLQGAQQPLGL